MAFTHVVALKFKEGTDAGVKDRISTQLAQLPGKIPQIRTYSFGVDKGLAPTNHHYAIVATFASEDDYKVYATHPEHQTVIREFIAPHLETRTAVQFQSHL